MIVIALDTPTEPQDAADALFATDNLKAGVLIGQYAKAKVKKMGITPKIAMIDLAPGISVGAAAPQRLPEGLRHQGGRPADRRRRRHAEGDQAKGQAAMENLLQKDPDINLVYTINEPSGVRRRDRAEGGRQGPKDFIIVSVDGGCNAIKNGIKTGIIDATSQQYPLKMAALGVEKGAAAARGGAKPSGLHRHRRDADHRQAGGRRGLQGRGLRRRRTAGARGDQRPARVSRAGRRPAS